jgi:eukaryotic-like serine/threonine-protein kinase
MIAISSLCATLAKRTTGCVPWARVPRAIPQVHSPADRNTPFFPRNSTHAALIASKFQNLPSRRRQPQHLPPLPLRTTIRRQIPIFAHGATNGWIAQQKSNLNPHNDLDALNSRPDFCAHAGGCSKNAPHRTGPTPKTLALVTPRRSTVESPDLDPNKPMPEQPPTQLVATLERLGLASAAQMARMGRRVKRLSRDLPRFDSVWIDALSQARILTPFQAAEIHAGRAESLRLGPYLLCRRLPHPHYVACYQARIVDSQQDVMLAVVDDPGPRTEEILGELDTLVGCVKRTSEDSRLRPSFLASITSAGVAGNRIFAAAPWVQGRTAAQWLVHHGRFPSEVVLEIARAMLAGLIELSEAGICHGDVSTQSLILTDSGRVCLSLPGLRAILRPEEGYAHADLLPEAYDSLAPERVSAGSPPDLAGDIYACGCVWWHLLCGRPPLTGGDSLAKLRAAQSAEICDVRRYAPDVAAPLAAAISACVQREPSRRPESLQSLAAMLGPPTSSGRQSLADCLAQAGRPAVRWTTTVRSVRKSNRSPLWIAGAICCVAAAVALFWPGWQRRLEPSQDLATQASAIKVHHPEQAAGRKPKSMSQKPCNPSPPAEVIPVAYQQVEAKPIDFVLAAEKPLTATSLNLQPGQCIRAPSGRRAMVIVPRAGLVVDKENVRFENIDFVWRDAQADDNLNNSDLTMVQLLVGKAEFRGCSFRCEGAEPDAVSAIRWVHPMRTNSADTSLPNGRLQLVNCSMRRVGAGLDCRTVGALAIEMRNLLHADAGPLVRLCHYPRPDEPTSIVISHVTLRGGGPLLESPTPRGEDRPGDVNVSATACAFVPRSGVPLVRLTGEEPHEQLLTTIHWSGQGSLAASDTAMIAWGGLDGREQPVDESSLSVAGLVRSEVGFAAATSDNPAASRLIRWQAPLQSADPPGIDPAPLPAAVP